MCGEVGASVSWHLRAPLLQTLHQLGVRIHASHALEEHLASPRPLRRCRSPRWRLLSEPLQRAPGVQAEARVSGQPQAGRDVCFGCAGAEQHRREDVPAEGAVGEGPHVGEARQDGAAPRGGNTGGGCRTGGGGDTGGGGGGVSCGCGVGGAEVVPHDRGRAAIVSGALGEGGVKEGVDPVGVLRVGYTAGGGGEPACGEGFGGGGEGRGVIKGGEVEERGVRRGWEVGRGEAAEGGGEGGGVIPGGGGECGGGEEELVPTAGHLELRRRKQEGGVGSEVRERLPFIGGRGRNQGFGGRG